MWKDSLQLKFKATAYAVAFLFDKKIIVWYNDKRKESKKMDIVLKILVSWGQWIDFCVDTFYNVFFK